MNNHDPPKTSDGQTLNSTCSHCASILPYPTTFCFPCTVTASLGYNSIADVLFLAGDIHTTSFGCCFWCLAYQNGGKGIHGRCIGGTKIIITCWYSNKQLIVGTVDKHCTDLIQSDSSFATGIIPGVKIIEGLIGQNPHTILQFPSFVCFCHGGRIIHRFSVCWKETQAFVERQGIKCITGKIRVGVGLLWRRRRNIFQLVNASSYDRSISFVFHLLRGVGDEGRRRCGWNRRFSVVVVSHSTEHSPHRLRLGSGTKLFHSFATILPRHQDVLAILLLIIVFC